MCIQLGTWCAQLCLGHMLCVSVLYTTSASGMVALAVASARVVLSAYQTWCGMLVKKRIFSVEGFVVVHHVVSYL